MHMVIRKRQTPCLLNGKFHFDQLIKYTALCIWPQLTLQNLCLQHQKHILHSNFCDKLCYLFRLSKISSSAGKQGHVSLQTEANESSTDTCSHFSFFWVNIQMHVLL